jgi:TIR domain
MSLALAARSMEEARQTLLASAHSTIFLSYAREDRADVVALDSLLQASGYRTWWDHRVDVGADFSERIREELERADAAVVLWSPASMLSQWVRWEANRALKLGKLVPLAAPDFDPSDLFPPFNTLNTLRRDDDHGLLDAIRRRIEARRAASA